MPENNGRKVFLVLALLIGAALLILLPDRPFRMGLDLEGGTRIVYSVDFQKALDEGKINAQQFQNKGALMAETIGLVRERIDPDGVLEPRIYPEGEERFVVEIPGIANLAEVKADLPLSIELRKGERQLRVSVERPGDDQQLLNFPAGGGVIRVGDSEQIRYDSRIGTDFEGLRRGVGGTVDSDHIAGETVHLVSNDPIKSRIENPGSLKFYIRAQLKDWPVGTDETTAKSNVDKWIEANPGAGISVYNRLSPEEGGPPVGIAWFPMRETELDRVSGRTLQDRLVPLAIPKEEWNFTGTDLEYVGPTWDDFNLPAIMLQLKSSKSPVFSDFTGEHVNQLMAIVISDEIASLANIQERLGSSFRITGQFTQQEVDSTVQVLRSGSLTYDVKFEEEERVGPTLGEQYIKQGAISVVLAFSVVLVFMLFYYRKLGVFAAISLLANLLLLMGAMAFMQATLTLPGVAGIILTVGMAVDANILIYERIREEQLKGSKVIQATKSGFQAALSTIVDANLTTLITAIILGYVGTGPVRGFATTLSVGILTSMFSALVITRLLVDMSLNKSSQHFGMLQLIGRTEVAFMKKARIAMPVSGLVIVVGLGLLSQVPSEKLFSIDFLGGSSLVIRTEKPQQTDAVRELVNQIEGAVGEHSEVSPLIDSGDSANGYKQFRITYKNVEGASESGGESTTEGLVKEKLASILQHGPVVVEVSGSTASGRLYFEYAHPVADITAIVEGVSGLSETSITEVPGEFGLYDFTAKVEPGNRPSSLITGIGQAFEGQSDSQGDALVLAQPVPEISSVGAQIVGELRDNAILAIVFSLFAVVLYIRMRFAEYSYGIAAVVALVHDVLITLGVLAVAIDLHMVAAELSLPMVAAFLTIIGYSLNDTIVVFDRIRENRPRMKGTFEEILNTSINQTLSRTLLTSATTLMAVVILFAFNYGSGSLLEGFAFALTIGVVVGTYSSI
ncbi:MAG: protein translocase subunit SecD, partial [Planctomycetes bacterium]|nr:protein translocase subunit SecD [Planctomycetota bacterium]